MPKETARAKRRREWKPTQKVHWLREAIWQLECFLRRLIAAPLEWFLRPPTLDKLLDLSEVNSVLILRFDALGDAVLTTPLWRFLRKRKPSMEIGVVGGPRNIALLQMDPDLDYVFLKPEGYGLDTIKFIREARKHDWDLVINVSFAAKSMAAIFARLIAPKAYRVTVCYYRPEKYAKFYSRVSLRPRVQPFPEQNLLALTTAVDVEWSKEDATPSIFVPSEARSTMSDVTTEILNARNRTRYILLNTDASQRYREWGWQNALEFSRQIEATHNDLAVLWTCAPTRVNETTQFLQSHNEADRLLNTQSIPLLAAAVERAVLVVSPDTSVVHIAVALNRPLIGLYYQHSEFSPYTDNARVFLPPEGELVNMIPVADVVRATNELINRDANN